MNDKEQKKPDEDHENETLNLTSEEETLQKLERILAGIRPGWKCAISRDAPAWAKSFLETIELEENDQLDLDYLAETWGGEVLRLRFMDRTGTYKASLAIPMRSYPVKVRGRKLLRNYDADYDAVPKSARFADQPPPPQIIQAPASPQPSENMIESVFKFAKNLTGDQWAVAQKILDMTQTDVPRVQNTFKDVIEAIYQIKEIQGVFGEADQKLAATGDDQAALFQTIGEVAKALLTNRQPPPQPRLLQQVPQKPASAPNNTQAPKINLPAVLAGMTPEQAVDICFSAMSRMPDQKKEQVINEFSARLKNNSDLPLDQGEVFDGDEEGDDYGDEYEDGEDEFSDTAQGADNRR